MLKLSTFNKVKHLIQTRPGIIVTNACNLSCGGCYAQCGKFSKDKMWFISLDQFKENLEYIIKYMYRGKVQMLSGEEVEANSKNHGIDLIGGEPTVHPEWGKIWEIITKDYKSINFLVSTNGRIKLPTVSNVGIHLDYKTKDVASNYTFVSTLVAPIDIIGNPDRAYYWDQAQTDCKIWKSLGCVNPIYKNQISICSVASSWNDLLDLELGWELTPNSNPFSNLTDEDVKKKAMKVCYRCGWSKQMNLPEDQKSDSYDLVSPTNLEVLQKNAKNKPYKLISVENNKIQVGELKNSRDNLVQLSLKKPILQSN